jgi:hypothetical protein
VFFEATGDNWIDFNSKALLVFSIYIGGEFIVVLLFYVLFRRYLGIINKESAELTKQ